MSKAFARAVAIIGSQSATAAVVGTTQQNISKRLRNGARVPAEWCEPLQRATGGLVTCGQLRPDIFKAVAAPSPEGAAA